MTKIMMFGAREDERPAALNWAEKNNVELTISSDILTPDTIDSLKGYDGVTTQQIGKLAPEIYERLEAIGIKQIAQRSAGYDMYDLEAAKAHHIIISNVPSYSPNSIAEYAVAMALNLVRKTSLIDEHVRRHDFRWQPVIMSKEIKSLTVAIIGTGRIGQITAKIFKGFDSNVVGYDLYPNDKAREWINYKDSVEEAIKDADIVSLHMPATSDNHHLFNKEMFAQFKKGAILINAARGSVIDTPALIEAIDSGQLAAAALDTYEFESQYFPKDFSNQEIEDKDLLRLIEHDKIIVTPHIAFYTDVAVQNLVEGGLNAALEVIQTGTCETRLN
ncbi:D-2-hydroxyacid dehydrogenase [Macrococcus brunensis]|uniref:D-2-hydroxyacid dehydrogenase n=1 Tax=Macrococcus brunensis TaxID=198483 RepID=UPI001EEF7E66|nr:D-2-hydroxyacid dehydrogenase [Macrococcus brunensis]ULG72032.1 D-2-hydroxyacid dehydrogenase [Macrococcus brunensis]